MLKRVKYNVFIVKYETNFFLKHWARGDKYCIERDPLTVMHACRSWNTLPILVGKDRYVQIYTVEYNVPDSKQIKFFNTDMIDDYWITTKFM